MFVARMRQRHFVVAWSAIWCLSTTVVRARARVRLSRRSKICITRCSLVASASGSCSPALLLHGPDSEPPPSTEDDLLHVPVSSLASSEGCLPLGLYLCHGQDQTCLDSPVWDVVLCHRRLGMTWQLICWVESNPISKWSGHPICRQPQNYTVTVEMSHTATDRDTWS